MRVTGSKIEYFFFIEGVRVPISSLQVSISVNGGAKLHATIPPLPQGLLLIRGMKVALFKKVDDDPPLLRFHGLLISKNYSKALGERSLSIDCASIDCRFSNMIVAEVTKGAIGGSVIGTFLHTNSESGEVKKVQTNLADIEKQIKEAEKLSKTKKLDEAEKLKNESLKERLKKRKDALEKELKNKLSTVKGITTAFTRFLGANSHMLYMPKSVAFDGTTQQIKPGKEKEWIKTTSKFYTTISGVFERALAGINARGEITEDTNPLNAMIEVLASVFESADPYSFKEFSQLKVFDQMYGMPVFNNKEFDISMSIVDKEKGSATYTPEADSKESAKVAHRNFGYTLLRMAEDMIAGQAAQFPIYSLISKMLDMLFCKVSVDPTKVKSSILFHPEMMSCVPPNCNIILPNMYSTVGMNYNMWTEPTRSIVVFPPKVEESVALGVDDSAMNNSEVQIANSESFIADVTDPYLQKISEIFTESMQKYANTDNASKFVKEDIVEKSDLIRATAFNTLTQEELAIGVSPNIVNLPFQPLAFLEDGAKGNLSNMIHSISKFSNRHCVVNCCLLDDLVVGMPVFLIDDIFSIYGILENVTYSVTPDGQAGCQLSIQYPKMIFNGEDSITGFPSWIDANKVSFDKIGELYLQLFGCKSAYDYCIDHDFKKDLNMETDLTYCMAKIAAHIINKYNEARDKLSFQYSLRSRNVEYKTDKGSFSNQVSMEEYFQSYLGCERDAAGVGHEYIIRWIPKDNAKDNVFSSYKTIEGTGLDYAIVDKQAIVNRYLEALYRGSVNGLIGGIVVNSERSKGNEIVVEYNDKLPTAATVDATKDSSSKDSTDSKPSQVFAKDKLPWNKIMKTRTYTSVIVDGGYISSAFGPRDYPESPTHHGVDIAGNVGLYIKSVTDGEVVIKGLENPRNSKQGYGLRLYIKTDKLVYIYAHLSRIQPEIEVGTKVRKGQIIAEVGETGSGSGSHLHFEINDGEKCYSPLPLLWELEPNIHKALTKEEVEKESPKSYTHKVSF